MFGYRRGGAPLNVLILLSTMSFLLYVDRVNLSTAASSIQAELGMTNTQLGIAFSAFAYSYAVFQVIGGWIADRIGSRVTLLVCGLIWVLTTIGTGLVGSFAALLAVRFVLGIGEGATLPAAGRASPTGRRAPGAASRRGSPIPARAWATRSPRRSSPSSSSPCRGGCRSWCWARSPPSGSRPGGATSGTIRAPIAA